MHTIILGSKSPRRAELLKKIHLDFKQVSLNAEEIWPHDMPADKVAVFLAELKSQAYRSQLHPEELLITADSVVIHEGEILGKPRSYEQAKEFLTRLSDSSHTVITGVCLTTTKKVLSFDEKAEVRCAFISPQETDFYIRNYQPYDKAGAYGIQEWLGLTKITKITGTYSNIMGLPTASLYEKLSGFFPEYLPEK